VRAAVSISSSVIKPLLPRKWCVALSISHCCVSISGLNPLTLTRFSG